MKNRVFSILKFLIGWPLSILAIFFIAKLIAPQTSTLLTNIGKLNWELLLYSIYCFLIFNFLRSYIWHKLINLTGHNFTFKETCFLWASSELKRFIPGNIWSFLGRTVSFAEKGVAKKDIAKNLIIEAELIVIGSIIVSLLSLPFLSGLISLPLYADKTIIFITLAGLLLYIFHSKLKLNHFILPAFKPIETLFLIFLSSLAFLFFGLGHFFAISSFVLINPNLIWQLTGLSVLAFLAGYLSILTPAGFGVREGALVFGLSKVINAGTAAFISLFSRFILIISELIFLLISFIWHKTRNKNIVEIEKFISTHKHETILFILFLIYTAYFTTTSFLRYDNFYTGRFDLGNMSQTVWNTTQGNIFMMTDANGTEIVSRLSVHADFILILLAPFYALWSDPRMLLLIQTIVLAAGSFFVYQIAKTVLKNKNLALTFAFAYLINPSIQRANLYDFHAVALATTFLLGAFYYFINKKYKLFLLFAFLAGICKEQVWAIVGLFGIFLFFQHKKRLFGVLLFVICYLLFYFLISYAIPNALGSRHFALEYYSEFGNSPVDIIKNIILSPQQTITTIMEPDRIHYLQQLLLPLGYLSLIAPIFLIFAAPDLVINLLSSNANLHQIYYQYTATITPFLFITAIYGATLIKRITMNIIIIIYLLTTSIYAAYLYGPLPGAKEANLDMITKPFEDKYFVYNYISKIDENSSIAASNNIGSHFSNREKIYVLPLGIDKADIVAFLFTGSEHSQSLTAQKILIENLKQDPSYQLEIERGKFIIFKKITE